MPFSSQQAAMKMFSSVSGSFASLRSLRAASDALFGIAVVDIGGLLGRRGKAQLLLGRLTTMGSGATGGSCRKYPRTILP
jgi:hypothetical protein